MCAILSCQEERMAKRLRLRALTRPENTTLRAKLRDLSLAARIHQRYRIVELARRGYRLVEVAERVGCHFTVAYDWVRRFNQSGFSRFEQVPNPRGRPPILRAEQLRELVEVARSSPTERGLPFTVWSVPKLAEYCRQRKLLPPVTDEWVRRLLRREGLSAQRVRTWKTSTDPDFDRKKPHPGSLSALSAPPRRSLLRRMGTAGTETPRRQGLGAAETTAARPGHLSPPARHRTVSGFLRCPCQLPERSLPPPQAYP
ncbi:MAG: hypothetical protein DMG21_01550 [Acidobacteria bacterium]|nr:MAG: hypothetical protein DMG21_01550 [Acidobacteriota bacterium]